MYMSYTLSFRHSLSTQVFFSTETPSSPTEQDAQKANILKSFPDLKKIADTISPQELYTRARILSKLTQMKDHPEETFGKVKSAVNAVGVANAQENLRTVITALTTNKSISNLGDQSMVAWFK